MIEWITSVTWRDVFFMFLGPVVVWLVWGIAKWLISGWIESVIADPWRIFRYWVSVVAIGCAIWLSERPELSPGGTLFMIICCLAGYWALTTQHQKNLESRAHGCPDAAANEEKPKVARNLADQASERKAGSSDERQG
ncbi:hypothetical protein H0A70_07980 [Alcaligenaceae bacterium]|nr:hypothetical protein [Alcaligenaceae bacterium]